MEQELILKAKAGDAEAFEQLVAPYLPTAFCTAALMTRCYYAAQDAVQEGLIEAYQNLGRFRPGSPFRPWFIKLVVHRALDQNRRVRKLVTFEPGEFEPAASEGNPEPLLLDAERRQHLWDAVQQLDLGHRTVIVLHYYQDVPVAEIASMLELAEGTVKSRLHTARRRIESLLKATDPNTQPLVAIR